MNKPRLIDANTLLDKLPYPTDYAESEFYGKILDVIEELPTAYDIDKVVEQLEEALKSYVDASNIFVNDIYDGMVFGMEKAIEIVKKGGAE